MNLKVFLLKKIQPLWINKKFLINIKTLKNKELSFNPVIYCKKKEDKRIYYIFFWGEVWIPFYAPGKFSNFLSLNLSSIRWILRWKDGVENLKISWGDPIFPRFYILVKILSVRICQKKNFQVNIFGRIFLHEKFFAKARIKQIFFPFNFSFENFFLKEIRNSLWKSINSLF